MNVYLILGLVSSFICFVLYLMGTKQSIRPIYNILAVAYIIFYIMYFKTIGDA